jgi:hypothetical protein
MLNFYCVKNIESKSKSVNDTPIELILKRSSMNDLGSYADLHQRTNGKISDKWDKYLDAYDNALLDYRHKPVSLLEIGVQNGGSLETWAQFLPRARNIMGCDINPDCGKLTVCVQGSRRPAARMQA